jgi:hypothetical protein
MADWQNQNFKKNGGASAPMQMNPKLLPSGSAAGLHNKIATPSYGMGGLVGTKTAARPVRKFADGTPGGVQFDQGEFAGVDKAVADNTSGAAALADENYGDGTTREQRMEMATGSKPATNSEVRAAADDGAAMPKTFKEAFAKNRADGNKTFEFGGKSFTTDIASEKPAKTAARPVKMSSSVSSAASKAAASIDSPSDEAPARSKSIMFNDAPAKAKSSFDPSSIDNFGPRPEAAKERTFRQTRGGRIYDDELPAKKDSAARVHPRTGRPL